MSETLLSIFLLSSLVAFSQQSQEKTFQISEANIEFTIEGDWEQTSKTGKMERGKVQYTFSHPHVQGSARLVNPSIAVTIDKGSWFENEAEYVKEKLDFHRSMDDEITNQFLPDDRANPVQSIQPHCATGESGLADNPFGQRLMLITFWNEKIGFHMEIQTSEKDLKLNPSRYKPVFKTQSL